MIGINQAILYPGLERPLIIYMAIIKLEQHLINRSEQNIYCILKL